ncbi:MAG: hypothetical protein LBL28_05220, partial [Treponema sp.]|nr:hypothetical protein [Treponema sp.]
KIENKYDKHYFKRLYFQIGSFYDDYQTIEIKNENNKLKMIYNSHRDISNKNNQIIVNTSEYHVFFDKLLKTNIENWENNYHHELYTGYNWELKVYFKQSIVYEKEGSNNYPENFTDLINLFKMYFPEFDIDCNKKATLNENDLLKLYCTHHPGFTFTEVSVGDKKLFGKNSKNRRIDMVRIHNDHNRVKLKYSHKKELFERLLNGNYKIEIIEIKTDLNRLVIGQIIVGEYMFKKKYNVNEIIKTILYHRGDEALETFCKENEINLVKY